jgi:hypothetical protein
MQPEFEDEEAIDPFDFWQGANFKLKAKNVAGYRNYDSSEFTAQSPVLEDDDALEALWKKENSLQDFVAPDQFKTYEVLRARLESVLRTATANRVDEDLEDESEGRGTITPDIKEPVVTAPTSSSDEDDDTLSYFAKLAAE